jgi:hypothetical protein
MSFNNFDFVNSKNFEKCSMQMSYGYAFGYLHLSFIFDTHHF